jgi:hypothetical protein
MMQVSLRAIDLVCGLMSTQDARVSYACRMVGSYHKRERLKGTIPGRKRGPTLVEVSNTVPGQKRHGN